MQLSEFLSALKSCPIIASVQASENSPLDDPDTLVKLARASIDQGVKVLRLQGVQNISAVRKQFDVPTIGLIKRRYVDSEVFITPTSSELDELIAAGCEVIALDGTERYRPFNYQLHELVKACHDAGRLAMADCDTVSSIRFAVECGADIISTTLSGYTPDSNATPGPDLRFVRHAIDTASCPVVAEGRFSQPWEIQAALTMGASGVVVGGAINDPVKQTAKLLEGAYRHHEPVGAVDIGGTWMRFGVFSPDWKMQSSDKVALPSDPADRLYWLREKVKKAGVSRVGISSGGTIEPKSHQVIEAKEIIPGHKDLRLYVPAVPSIALNDGLATAWGHACWPDFAGLRVATLTIGTGVGCGFVAEGRLWMGPSGQYPRLNDLPTGLGMSYEEILGGATLTPNPSEEQQDLARRAVIDAIRTVQTLWLPDVIVFSGGVGLSEWLFGREFEYGKVWGPDDQSDAGWHWPKLVRSPFGPDAGLYGAAALALFPPLELADLLGTT